MPDDRPCVENQAATVTHPPWYDVLEEFDERRDVRLESVLKA